MTKFPPRPLSNDGIDDVIEICDCGHPDYVHYDTTTSENGKCYDCMCPLFNFQHKSTQRQYFRVMHSRNRGLTD